MAIGATSTYEAVCAAHRWNVPAQYNIAADVCDKHSRDKPAMIWESYDGSVRELAWGELQDLANQAAHTLAARGVKKGDRVAVLLPPTPETAAVFFGSCTPTVTSSPTRNSCTAIRSRTASASTAWASGRGRQGSRRSSVRGGWERCNASTAAKPVSTRTSNSIFSAATR